MLSNSAYGHIFSREGDQQHSATDIILLPPRPTTPQTYLSVHSTTAFTSINDYNCIYNIRPFSLTFIFVQEIFEWTLILKIIVGKHSGRVGSNIDENSCTNFTNLKRITKYCTMIKRHEINCDYTCITSVLDIQ